MRKRHRLALSIAVLGLWGGTEGFCADSKLDASVGFYDFTAKTSTRTGSAGGLGMYSLTFRRAISNRFEVLLGYTLFFSNFISGDSAFGIDLGVVYFPLTQTSALKSQGDGKSIEVRELWRPFVGATFHQRNFQSVQSSYAGFGLISGIERSLDDHTSLLGTVRYITLSGARGATATETALLLGVSIGF